MNCRYNNILGAPRTGFHSARFAGLAVYDLIGTIVIALLAWLLIKHVRRASPVLTMLGLFVIGQLCHLMFCVDTAFIRMVAGWLVDAEL